MSPRRWDERIQDILLAVQETHSFVEKCIRDRTAKHPCSQTGRTRAENLPPVGAPLSENFWGISFQDRISLRI